MSKNNLIKTIETELSKINQQIDLKIIKGVSYARESKQHKFLLSRLSRFAQASNANWMRRMANIVPSLFF